MAGHFEISPYFTFRWCDNDISSPYNTLPLESQVDDLSYHQPVQCGGGGYQSDTGQIQLTSDFVPTGSLHDLDTNAFIKNIDFVPLDPPILGYDFVGYNAEIDFSDVDPGTYYGKITYTDGDAVNHDWRTNPLDVQIYHEGTQLFEATNFTNDKGVVFVNSDLTTLTIRKRIGSLIRSPLVKADADDYEDQYNDLTQETSIPFVVYTQLLYSANGFLLPFYEIEKINLLYSLNQVLIDGQPFAKIAKSDFKPTRGDISPQGAWWEVDIQPNFNYPNDQFITGTPETGQYLNDKVYKKYEHQSADFAISGIITADINLIRIAIINYGLDAFTMNVGITDGGFELGKLSIPDDNTDSIDIGKVFKVPTTIYITGITGADLDIILDYNNYNAVPIAPPTQQPLFAKNTVYYFMEVVPGSFAVEFDVASGLGRVDTDHEGCVLAGRAGTPPMAGKVVKVWDSEEVGPSTRGTSVGSDSLTLSEVQLPEHSHNVFNGDSQNASGNDLTPGGGYARMQRNAGINRDYNISQSGTIPDRGPTSDVGEGEVIDITPSSIILPAFYYVGV